MPDEEVGLHKELCGIVDGTLADGESPLLHQYLQVLNRERSFKAVDGIEDGKAFARLPELMGDEELAETVLDFFCDIGHEES